MTDNNTIVLEVERLALGVHQLVRAKSKLEEEQYEIQKKIDDHNSRIEEMRKLIGDKLK